MVHATEGLESFILMARWGIVPPHAPRGHMNNISTNNSNYASSSSRGTNTSSPNSMDYLCLSSNYFYLLPSPTFELAA